MSSHHFVKDGQEPALVIANGEMCAYEILTSLMEWCPYMVVCDGAYTRIKNLQITPDVVIGDFDSLENVGRELHTQYIHLEDQETTDLEKAIDHLVEKGYTDINVIWASGKRLDHTINNFATLAKYFEIRIVLIDDYSRSFILPKNYNKRYEKGQALSLVPIHTCSGITTQNLKYNLDNETLSFGKRSGTSNEATGSGLVEICHTSGLLALIESTD
ncbi:MAG: thiamine diphosphokinase [Bacteroidia bacterium]|jgi:thiamine pyrophosphokinase|tara:strand:+ start:249 stop:896 length:648 start_codon:yes stop_codon:yes gene_type:complete